METTYYSLDARRMTVYDMASGETAPRRYTCLRPSAPPSAETGEGKVLDVASYRRALSTAGEDGLPPEEPPAAEEREPAHRSVRRRLFPAALEVCATLALIVMACVVVLQFLPLL